MIDVCFSRPAEGLLRYIKNDMNSKAVFHLGGYFEEGDLTESPQEHYAKAESDTLRYFYADIGEEEISDMYKYELKQIRTRHTKFRKFLDNGESVRVWINQNANDYCGFYWLCNELREYTNRIYLVICPSYQFSFFEKIYTDTFGWLIEPENLLKCIDSAKEINAEEKQYFAEKWHWLVKENSSFRILIEDTVISAEKDFFDSIILNYIPEVPTEQAKIMGEFMGLWKGCLVSLVSARIEYFIKNGLVKVCEEAVNDEGCYWPRKIARVGSEN